MIRVDRLEPPATIGLSRRTLLAAGAVLGVSGCAGFELGGARSRPPAPPGTTVGLPSQVAVGSATIFSEHGVVVTRASAGDYAAFSTVCPHQGCAVASVQGRTIVCPCHGSTFALDGSVITGPATTGLQRLALTVQGDRLTLA